MEPALQVQVGLLDGVPNNPETTVQEDTETHTSTLLESTGNYIVEIASLLPAGFLRNRRDIHLTIDRIPV
jgi:hypothetical protein